MLEFTANNKRHRHSFSKIESTIELPSLIDIQKNSYEQFLQTSKKPDAREDVGLQGVFKSVFPIHDLDKTSSLEFVKYHLEKPKYDVDECRERGMTFAAPLKITVRLVVWDVNEETNTRTIRDVKEQEIYLGELPLMTDTGSFIINGTERVVVSQLHRSPGVFFSHDGGKTHSSGKLLYSARVIPNRGSWLDFEFDHKDTLHARIDRRRKIHATILLRALGYSTEELLHYFYNSETIYLDGNKFLKSLELDLIEGLRADQDIRHPKTNEVLVKKNRKLTPRLIETLKKAKIKQVAITQDEVLAKISYSDVADPKSGEILLECNEQLTADKIKNLKQNGIKEIKVLYIDGLNVGAYLRDTLVIDKVSSTDEAILEIYKKMRPGEPPTIETAKNYFDNLFFSMDRYDLSKVGRLKINHKFGLNVALDTAVLTKEDILATVRHLIELRNGRGVVDDIDHLGNRRVRPVGELVENQFRVGLVRMERAIRERMSLHEVETLMPHDLVNTKPVSSAVKEFFASSQLSQFMDQTNPLSEITHKRRLSALGPGGLTRERAGFEVRDVHTTHYGRICPIETPEGPNIGLISSLSSYARVNDFGFIETPYRKVLNGKVSEEVVYLTALDEEKYAIAQANAKLSKDGKFVDDRIQARKEGEPGLMDSAEISMMDVSPSQLVSVAASLVPFLENDDANRALMGSNMQRQAVPLLKTRSPMIGTGMEQTVARDSGVTVVAKNDGIVESVEATRIVVRTKGKSDTGSEVDIYNLVKYRRSNQNTCLNQKPIVKKGDEVFKGDVIADGPATELGELALGQNVTVAFMSWGGYNFEDSILVSEKLIKEDTYTSIHIEEFECISRDTKLGPEEVTRDIPNMSENALKDLDSSGIVRIGAEVKPGDILVGKVTPKGETQLSPEEKLLRAIFGEKAGNVKDTSLRVPPGVEGTIIGAQVFSREGSEKDERAKNIQAEEIEKLRRDQHSEIDAIQSTAKSKLERIIVGEKTTGKLLDERGKEKLLEKGEKITPELYESLPYGLLAHIPLDKTTEDKIKKVTDVCDEQIRMVQAVFDEKVDKLKKGDELPPGVIKMVKVFVTMKRKLSVGDKMAGRHGNKGVVSQILPEEDMPFFPDGRAVDIVLNPLGVPSRMNVGQILETHLGWAAYGIGEKVDALLENWNEKNLRTYLKKVYPSKEINEFIDSASEKQLKKIASKLKHGIHFDCPVFQRPSEDEIKGYLSLAELPSRGQITLFDGRTGEAFDSDVTVGIMYVLKLHHLVEDKIHARSIGPYSLVTQQPLGGKAQFGGQRLGEMEVWAMESYGAAYALQEFLTVKSDDVAGRTRIYEAIIKGENILEPGIPESFNVLIKELQSLALNVELIEDHKS
ncbi:MAG: DNA-directed RNA polymerase subunit beta [Deltaproteobacteria bacterium RIFCSPHIGHO2_02_FULL_40_11]|nr:MAG: DNA-directed RNA polymerase subunit beta [Deltaproteobacteria bacterium RIFCSPHIGHO2_02_FULL_40_11]